MTNTVLSHSYWYGVRLQSNRDWTCTSGWTQGDWCGGRSGVSTDSLFMTDFLFNSLGVDPFLSVVLLHHFLRLRGIPPLMIHHWIALFIVAFLYIELLALEITIDISFSVMSCLTVLFNFLPNVGLFCPLKILLSKFSILFLATFCLVYNFSFSFLFYFPQSILGFFKSSPSLFGVCGASWHFVTASLVTETYYVEGNVWHWSSPIAGELMKSTGDVTIGGQSHTLLNLLYDFLLFFKVLLQCWFCFWFVFSVP